MKNIIILIIILALSASAEAQVNYKFSFDKETKVISITLVNNYNEKVVIPQQTQTNGPDSNFEVKYIDHNGKLINVSYWVFAEVKLLTLEPNETRVYKYDMKSKRIEIDDERVLDKISIKGFLNWFTFKSEDRKYGHDFINDVSFQWE